MVDRYEPQEVIDNPYHPNETYVGMEKENDGEWVKHSDYEALEKENAELKIELGLLRESKEKLRVENVTLINNSSDIDFVTSIAPSSLVKIKAEGIRDFMALHAIDMGDYYEVSMKAVDKLEQNNETP